MAKEPTNSDQSFETLEQAAAWMLAEVQKTGFLAQYDAILAMQRFGNSEMWYLDEIGTPCISRKVLYRFKKISPSIVYDRWLGGWTPRSELIHYDPGRGQS